MSRFNRWWSSRKVHLVLPDRHKEVKEWCREAWAEARKEDEVSDRGKEISDYLKSSATSAATTYFPEDEPVRTFTSGATRSPLRDKLEYHKFLDPRVLKRWCEYLQKHRVQTDGNVREPNNYKKGIPIEAYVGSLMRHMMDVWFWNDNYQAEMTEEIEDSLCAILFNTHGLLFELLKERR